MRLCQISKEQYVKKYMYNFQILFAPLGSTASNACESQPCKNQGTCSPNSAVSVGYTCLCSPGYSGSDCSTGK